MKKKVSKNYIAFTLTEMTMVLLIMSVIAAVSAPLVKHAVSDVTNHSEPTKQGGIWRKINNLDGIFYSSAGNGMVSVNYIPTADPINYGYPTMIINNSVLSRWTPQIGVYSSGGIYMGNDTGKQAITIGGGYFFAGSGYNRMGGIDIGSEVNNGSEDNIEILGNSYKGTYEVSNSISVDLANQIVSNRKFSNSILIGYSSATVYDDDIITDSSITIGEQGRRWGLEKFVPPTGNRNINVGLIAGSNSYSNNSINIGLYAGSGCYSITTSNNINIGRYSSSLLMAESSDVSPFYGNISIGNSAGIWGKFYTFNYNNFAIGFGVPTKKGSAEDILKSMGSNNSNTSMAIGSFIPGSGGANAFVNSEKSLWIGNNISPLKDTFKQLNSVVIGEADPTYLPKRRYAQYIIGHNQNSVIIGKMGGGLYSNNNETVYIGNSFGPGVYALSFDRSVVIGNSAGIYSGVGESKESIIIGNYAGANFFQGGVIIGNFPKHYARQTPIAGVEGKIYLYAGSNYYGRDYGYNGYITLAAKNVYAVNYSYGNPIKVYSDVRSKRNISLAPYGIKDFRKFNIYNFSLKYDKDHLKNIGVIAQEYRKAFPLAIVKGGKYLSIQPDWLYYSMINAVKDLDKLVQEFQVKLDEYVNNFESIKSRISTLEQSVAEEKQNNANMRKELEQINAQLLAKTKNK